MVTMWRPPGLKPPLNSSSNIVCDFSLSCFRHPKAADCVLKCTRGKTMESRTSMHPLLDSCPLITNDATLKPTEGLHFEKWSGSERGLDDKCKLVFKLISLFSAEIWRHTCERAAGNYSD